jgi:hypothetical protein
MIEIWKSQTGEDFHSPGVLAVQNITVCARKPILYTTLLPDPKELA